MILNSPTISGSLTVTGNIIASGSITLSGSVASASYAATASFVALAQSASNAVSAATASSADNFLVRNTLTAQTLVVQTITSSIDFVTGSTRFGSSLSTSTHEFTGSVSITGSLAVVTTGTEFQVNTTGVNLGNALTDSHVISGSLTVNPGGLFVSGSGNVGINTTSPSSKLHVVGSSLTDTFRITDASNYTIVMGYSGSANVGMISTLGGTAKLALGTNSAARLTIDGTGNVGIGTTNPGSYLDVIDEDGGQQMARIRNFSVGATGNFTGNYMVELRAARTGGAISGSLLVHAQEADDTRPTMDVSDSNGVFTRFVNGKVGIGTIIPAYTLDVSGNVGATRFWVASGGNATDPMIRVKDDTDTGIFFPAANTIAFSTAANERMRITSDGAPKFRIGGATLRDVNNSVPEISQALNVHCLALSQKTSDFSQDGFGAFGIAVDRANTSAYVFAGWYSSTTSDKEFSFRGDGQAYADGSWNGGGADYAEYFEWLDGNPNNEDRRGYSVSLVGNKIKIAEQGEKIIGIISGNPSVIGDSAWNIWNEKYLKDDFGTYIRDENGYRILNQNYNSEIEYIPREKRKEWSVVGLMGKLRIKKGQETMPTWIKMRNISDNVEEWLIK